MDCQKTPGDRSAYHRATQLHRRGFTKGAVDVLEVELFRSPDDGLLWRLRAQLLYELKRYDEALVNVEHAQLLTPLDVCDRLVLADCLHRVDKVELARGVYRAVVSCRT